MIARMTSPSITTADELLAAGDIGRCELIRGKLIPMSPSGYQHGGIAVRITARLATFVERHDLGIVLGAEAGFVLWRRPDTVRAPDVSFICKARQMPDDFVKYYEGAPDLAVEVLSPDDRPGKVREKVQDWLDAGCRAVWVVDPKKNTLTVHRPGGPTTVVREDEVLRDEEVVVGFEMRMREIF